MNLLTSVVKILSFLHPTKPAFVVEILLPMNDFVDFYRERQEINHLFLIVLQLKRIAARNFFQQFFSLRNTRVIPL